MPEYNEDQHFIQTVAFASSKVRSGVRAQWTELPDCMRWCNYLDDTYGKALEPAGADQPAGLYIPLHDDLSNAIIATCKGPEPGWGAGVCIDPVAPPPPSGFVPHSATPIYDPVWKTQTTILDSEH